MATFRLRRLRRSRAESISKKVRCASPRSLATSTVTGRVDSVNIEDVSGAVSLNGDFYEDIRLSKIAKSVVFKTSRSDMEFASLTGDLDIASDEVRGSQLNGPSRVNTSSKDIHLEDVSGDLQVQSNNGDVEITTSGKQPAGKVNVTTEHGDVAVTMAGKTTPDKVNVATSMETSP